MPLTLANVTQANVENEVSAQYRAAGPPALPRVVHIEGWQATDRNGDFIRAFGGGRRQRTDQVIEVTTERVRAGRIAVYLIPNTGNAAIRNLHGTMKLKVGEANI